MIEIFSKITNSVQIISLCIGGIVAISGTMCEIIGIGKVEKILSEIGFDNAYNRILILGYVMFALLLLTSFLKAKVFEK